MVSPAELKRYRSLISQLSHSLALSTPSGFCDMASRNNCIPIVEFSSSLQCSRNCAGWSESRRRDRLCTNLRRTENAKYSIQRSFQCCDGRYRNVYTTETAALAGVSSVSIDYFRSDRIHTESIYFRPRDALADWSRVTAAWAVSRHLFTGLRSRR